MTRSIQFLKRQKKSKYEKDVTKVETDIPTLKTSISNDYTIYINQDLNHMKILSKFYAFKTAKDIFHLYQVRQIVPEEMVNMLVHDVTKYDKNKRKKKNKKKEGILDKEVPLINEVAEKSKQKVRFFMIMPI